MKDKTDQSYVAGTSRLAPRRLDNELQYLQTLLSKPLDATATFPSLSEELFQTGNSTAYLLHERNLSSLRKIQAMRERQFAELAPLDAMAAYPSIPNEHEQAARSSRQSAPSRPHPE